MYRRLILLTAEKQCQQYPQRTIYGAFSAARQHPGNAACSVSTGANPASVAYMARWSQSRRHYSAILAVSSATNDLSRSHEEISSVSLAQCPISAASQHPHLKSIHEEAGASPVERHRVQKVTAEALMIPELFSDARISLPVPKAKTTVSRMDTVSSSRALTKSRIVEQMAMIYGYIQSSNIDQAETLFNRCLRSNPVDMLTHITTSFINRFIDVHLNYQPPTNEVRVPARDPESLLDNLDHEPRAFRWLSRFPDFNIQKNMETFAILCHHYFKTGAIDKVKQCIEELESSGFHVTDLFEDHRFSSQNDRAPLEALLRSMEKLPNGVVPSTVFSYQNAELDDLMMSVLSDTNTAIEAGHLNRAKYNSTTEGDALDLDSVAENSAGLEVSAFTQEELRMIKEESSKEIQSTDVQGVQILKNSLLDMGDPDKMTAYRRQVWLEERAHQAAVEKHEEFLKSLPKDLLELALIPSKIMADWYMQLYPVIKDKLATIDEGNASREIEEIAPLLKLFSAKTLCIVAIREVLKSPPHKGSASNLGLPGTHLRSTSLVQNVGNNLQREHNIQQMKVKANQKIAKVELGIHKLHTTGRLADLSIRKAAAEMLKTYTKLNSVQTHVKALEFKNIAVGSKSYGFVIRHDSLLEMMSASTPSISPFYLPMLVQPRPWLNPTNGGYLLHKSNLVRIVGNPEHHEYIRAADEANHLSLIFRAIDKLGKTPWVINTAIYKVARSFWNNNEHVDSLPGILELPEIIKPDNYSTCPIAKKTYDIAVRKRFQAIGNNHSQRCDVNYKLEIARSYLGETIYFPHNLDFRGRAYPMPPNLNHIGNDLCRGLLKFKETKPLGQNGLRWLKIQVSNLAGNDKVSMDDREKFAEDHREDIIDSAENPIDGKRWWFSMENPWQLLSTCIELCEAWKLEDPTQFRSSIPIHQDGSCNGLQHYAALGGDEAGAKAVNLIPSDVPQDVYMSVATLVMDAVEKDVANNVSEAILLQGRINRKLVKQTVMTNTYGVTFIGARDQVRSRLIEARSKEDKATALTDENIKDCSLYATRRIFESMGTIFEGARAIQLWLNETAQVISKSIPEEDIPEIQILDSSYLKELNLLPTPLTVLQKEQMEVRKALDLPPAPVTNDDEFSFLEEAITADQQAGHAFSGLMDDIIGSDIGAGNASSSIDSKMDVQENDLEKQMNDALSAKSTITIKKKRDDAPTRMTSVTWTTPLGLPIVQPYRKHATSEVKTAMQTFSIINHDDPAPVNSQKQSTAFPPNFVHSLDSSHMMLSAIACESNNIEFAAVHDSYWTHASTVDDMNKILREAFVRLHSEDIMVRLRDELMARYKSHKVMIKVPVTREEDIERWNRHLVATGRRSRKKSSNVTAWVDLQLADIPKRGSFDIHNVRNSTYFSIEWEPFFLFVIVAV
ncbi:hypothetical protein BSLG_006430 [Batrachochytrium salamandrivorans]|nr:hypothetical protein BSLG_006430 [Batrachochytrium salamandrivorans]